MPNPAGPLRDIHVLELGGLAPGPFAGMFLADYGARVTRIDRPVGAHSPPPPSPDVLVRGKTRVELDLKAAGGRERLLDMLAEADVLIDPFRPGVLERLVGLEGGVKGLLKRFPRLVLARLTGFRRDGPYRDMAGHDVNYLAVSGMLSMLGPVGEGERALPPSAPGNMLGDFAGGGLMCVAGVLLALVHREREGKGQVVEVNMVDGVAYLGTAMRLGRKVPGQWDRGRADNLADGGCPYYGVYECADVGRYMSVAALEAKFFVALCKGLGIKSADWGGDDREDRTCWPTMRKVLQDRFRKRTRQEWEEVFQGTDACCLPVLTQAELEARGYEQRPAVGLSVSPSKGVSDNGWQPRVLETDKPPFLVGDERASVDRQPKAKL